MQGTAPNTASRQQSLIDWLIPFYEVKVLVVGEEKPTVKDK
jgi:hypothetical protein